MSEQPFRTVTNLRKSGNLQEAWNVGFVALEQSPQDAYLKGSLFWVCYEYLKQHQEKITKRGASSNNYRPTDFEFKQIENLLQTIMGFQIPTGGLEYKMLLVQCKKNIKWFPTLIHCVLNHQDTLFDHEAKQPFQAEKGEVPSLMLSTARQVASGWLRAREDWQLDFNRVMGFLDLTRQQVSDIKHLIWLDYDQAKCLVVSGQYEQARALILPILRKKQSESWAWGALAATYQNQDSDLAIKFFAKGITSAHEITFSLKLLQGVIPLLLAKQQQAEASMCLKTALSVYRTNGWKIKKELAQLSVQPWYDEQVEEKKLIHYLKSISQDALDYLLGPTEKLVAIVENIHKSGMGFHAFVNRSTSLSVRMGIHKSKTKPSVGDYVSLCVSKQDGEQLAVSSTPCNKIEIADVSFVEGSLRVAPKGFGFVEGTFVPPFVIGDIKSETQVSAQRVMTWDKTKSRYNWKAIKLTVLSEPSSN
jgi:tetratricopeptide (TPR) repeat protein